jgi:hypothetical protein
LDETIFLVDEVPLKPTFVTINAERTFIGGDVMHSAEWLPASITPPEGDLELCVLDYNGLVQALAFPCRRDGDEWVDASGRRQGDIQPTHWRKWIDRH